MTVSFLGAGNVAHHLIRSMIQNTVQIKQIYNRSLEKAAEIGEVNKIPYTNDINKLEKADIFIIATADDVIEDLSQKIPYPDSIVVHTSGATPISALKGNYKKGVIYPLQTFSKNRYLRYDDIPFFIEGEDESVLLELKKLTKRISHRIYELDSEKRKQIHLSAVFSCNFVNFLYGIGQEIVENTGLDFSVLRPLIDETAKKIMDFKPETVQTGPAIRKDKKTINAHLALLDKLPDEKEIYKLLTDSIIKKYNDL